MNRNCDVWHSRVAHRSVESLFALQLYQHIRPGDFQFHPDYPENFMWMRRELEPYTRHPLMLGAHKVNHGLPMETGFGDSYEQLDLVKCNIIFDCWSYDAARGGDDANHQRMQELLVHAPLKFRDWPLGIPDNVAPVPQLERSAQRKESAQARKDRLLQLYNMSLRRHFNTVPAATGRPSAANLTNRNNVCYAAVVLQVCNHVPELRQVVLDSATAPHESNTGRLANELSLRGDLNMKKHKTATAHLRAAMNALDSNKGKVTPVLTENVLRAVMALYSNSFRFGQEDDPGALLDTIVDILNTAGDVSLPFTAPTAVVSDGPLRNIMQQYQEERFYHRQKGADSTIETLLGMQIAVETVCTQPDCATPVRRKFEEKRSIKLNFPVDALDQPDRPYTMDELIDASDKIGTSPIADDIHLSCASDESHVVDRTIYRRILQTPTVLVIKIERHRLTSLLHASERDMERSARFLENPIDLGDGTIDLERLAQAQLPSEATYGAFDPSDKPATRYRLRGVLAHKTRHFIAMARIADEQGYFRWAAFDDRELAPHWAHPADNQLEPMYGICGMVYTLMSEEEIAAFAAEAALNERIAGPPSELGDETNGTLDGATIDDEEIVVDPDSLLIDSDEYDSDSDSDSDSSSSDYSDSDSDGEQGAADYTKLRLSEVMQDLQQRLATLCTEDPSSSSAMVELAGISADIATLLSCHDESMPLAIGGHFSSRITSAADGLATNHPSRIKLHSLATDVGLWCTHLARSGTQTTSPGHPATHEEIVRLEARRDKTAADVKALEAQASGLQDFILEAGAARDRDALLKTQAEQLAAAQSRVQELEQQPRSQAPTIEDIERMLADLRHEDITRASFALNNRVAAALS